jgi:hypothetical protein
VCRAHCAVFLYDIAAKTKTQLPVPSAYPELYNYSSGVTKDGVVYTGRSRAGCGAHATIVRYLRDDDPPEGTVLVDLHANFDFSNGFVRENPDGSVDFYYDRTPCTSPRGNIYRVTDPAPPPGP